MISKNIGLYFKEIEEKNLLFLQILIIDKDFRVLLLRITDNCNQREEYLTFIKNLFIKLLTLIMKDQAVEVTQDFMIQSIIILSNLGMTL